MPVLSNARHEHFAQEIARGETITQAYVKAGYKLNSGNASELAADERITKRVGELLQARAARKGITIDSLCDELDEARALAMSLDHAQPASAIAASMGKAKLMGLLVERKESGKPGDFNNMSIEELRKQLKADLDALEAMRAKSSETSH